MSDDHRAALREKPTIGLRFRDIERYRSFVAISRYGYPVRQVSQVRQRTEALLWSAILGWQECDVDSVASAV